MNNQKPFTDENVKDNSVADNVTAEKQDENYTFVEERIVTKRQRMRRVLANIFLHLLVPVCVCLAVCYIYINTFGDDDDNEPDESEETTSENSIVVNGNEGNQGNRPPSFGNQEVDLENEENLILLEENINKMVVVVSVVRDKTSSSAGAKTNEESTEDTDDDINNDTDSDINNDSENKHGDDKDSGNVDYDDDIDIESYEEIKKYTGVIVSMNGPVYILIPYRNIEGQKEIYTHIGNEPALQTTVYDIDYATGLALLKIEDSKITGAYRKQMTVATFEGINQVDAGSTVVYCGNVIGSAPMFVKGSISNTSNYVSCIDLTYNMLITDIVMDESEDGFLFNSKGNLVGIAGMSHGNIELTNYLAAARAVDLEYIINNMLNDKKDIYFGITGQEVSAEIEEIAGGSMPRGIYVSSVLIDSPAYNAGIMAGDIIFKIDGLYEPDMNVFRNYIERREKGDTIQVKVKRKIGNEYNEYSMTVTLNSRD